MVLVSDFVGVLQQTIDTAAWNEDNIVFIIDHRGKNFMLLIDVFLWDECDNQDHISNTSSNLNTLLYILTSYKKFP